ncbi:MULTISPECIES: TrbG/VirB9 family P-type conjugative transfer protein [Salipiger]|uniref:Type IV secretion system protein VirB9 n=1 Tax=Salipiger profundus TaxID=1229727 RepID=A0A1U7DDR2_9RHOB|nr:MULTISPECIES: TrbG/VirB9 family P-type conjugative transfer protein [Salipiger]APX26317.1 type IV secretion system protein VirB9 [Salipiger profundus]GGA21578.1 P-type conjugative transfer protein VirB9 [Salipiger profundus]
MRHTNALMFVALLLLPLPALAERAPQTMGQDARVRSVWYNPSDVIRVDTNLRTNTALELGRGERIEQVLLGDSEAFDVEVLSNRNTVSVKPVIGSAHSNMTIYTSRRAIAFVLTEGRSKTPTYRVAVKYPEDQPARTSSTPKAIGTRDTGYEYAGGGQARPKAVWNDGHATYFEFRQGVRPSIFAVDGEGYELTVNSQTRGRVVRVGGVAEAFTIRIGDEVICIRHVAGGKTVDPFILRSLAGKEF